MLRSLAIVVGKKCNLRCTYCFNDTHSDSALYDLPHYSERELPWSSSDIEMTIAHAKAAGYRTIVLTGGEPLIYPATAHWMIAAKRADMQICLITNLTLLRQEMLDTMLECGSNLNLYVSLGGVDKHSHNLYRQKWDDTLKGITLLRDTQTQLHLALTLTHSLLPRLKEYELLALDWKATPHVAAVSLPQQIPSMASESLQNTKREEWDAALRELTDETLFRETLILRSFYLDGLRPEKCPMRSETHVLLPNGNLIGCFYHPEIYLGNAKEGGILEIKKRTDEITSFGVECFGEHCLTNHYN